MFKKVSVILSVAAIAISGVQAQESKALDIFTGKSMTENQIAVSDQAVARTQNFIKLHSNDVPMAPLSEFTVSGPKGTVTIYNTGVTQIKGTYNGAQFNTVGASQIPFTGRKAGNQGGNAFVQFFSPKATIIVANNYPTANIPAADLAALEAMSPGCTAGGKVKTAVVLAKPTGMEVVAGFNSIVPLN